MVDQRNAIDPEGAPEMVDMIRWSRLTVCHNIAEDGIDVTQKIDAAD
jgi:hypothetical protein